MSFPAASVFLKALGWALVNSVWQFALCCLLYSLLSATIKNMAAAMRHTIALLFLSSGTVCFIVSFCHHYYTDASFQTHSINRVIIENTSLYNSWYMTGHYTDALMPYWSLLYLLCVLLLFIKLCVFVQRAGNLQHTGITKMSAYWRTTVKTISQQLGIRKEVKAFLSAHIDTPQVIGFLKPVILIPAACFINLTTEQLEAVILHELVHIKRNDYFVNLFVAGIEILFFFNPFVKQLTAAIRKEREYSCDDMVIQFQFHPGNYAAALLALEKNRLAPVTYGIAANGKDQKQLLARIERIIGIKQSPPALYHGRTVLLMLILVFFYRRLISVKNEYHCNCRPGFRNYICQYRPGCL